MERRSASFDSREMNYYVHGGKHVVEVIQGAVNNCLAPRENASAI
jgi:hypothetical protein